MLILKWALTSLINTFQLAFVVFLFCFVSYFLQLNSRLRFFVALAYVLLACKDILRRFEYSEKNISRFWVCMYVCLYIWEADKIMKILFFENNW